MIEKFQSRHIGSQEQDTLEMLQALGLQNLEELVAKTVPSAIRLSKELDLPQAQSETKFLKELKSIALKNKIYRSYIGMGYYGTVTPNVILRNILENPGWYTAYTPYQAEIAQGRLEMLINYQTVVIDLTGMEIANASLLDEATAAAEAMAMLYALKPTNKANSNHFFVSNLLNPQTIDVLVTRAKPIGVEIVIDDSKNFQFEQHYFGAIVGYPNCDGSIEDHTEFIDKSHKSDIFVTVVADLLSLTLIKSPGEMGADVVVGSAQRFGVPMGYGGPHAAFFATKDAFKRQMPGRIIGVSQDAQGKKAYRMALQTREQHIRREKATSNICTAQVLLSVMAGAYAIYHGPDGLKIIANDIHKHTTILAEGIKLIGYQLVSSSWFDTITVLTNDTDKIKGLAESKCINFRILEDRVSISLDQTVEEDDLKDILEIFYLAQGRSLTNSDFEALKTTLDKAIPSSLLRTSSYLTHPIFHTKHSEHEMLRYLKHLENKDLSMVHSMISLGSCTMKLNATTEMIPVTWPEFGQLHPFVPKDQALGYYEIFEKLEKWLAEITGFYAVSLQPNSGAQGEYAGLMVIRAYHESNNESNRNIALIPSSAHGTNPASAVMAGMKVIVTKCDQNGNIDIEDLRKNALQNKDNLACLMVTYPSTHGVFEESIQEITALIHEFGGLVYMDGANMNAQVGLTSPGNIGADVCHLNLHKTFCIPHGGGGPGMGPIGVVEKLAPFLPSHKVVKTGGENAISAISAAPFGSASILLISYAYISMMGTDGLKDATAYAILNANYMKAKLLPHFPILYTGKNGMCAHEMIVDCRQFKHTVGIEVEDIAKRLMDYGFHAPTVSFPVAGTLMIEPTESETKHELDRFVEAMISIRKEIAEVENGQVDKLNNVLKHAPHTAEVVLNDNWDRPYSREKAVYPLPSVKLNKFWPAVSRIDSAFGDRNLMCSCVPIEEFMEVPV